MSANLLSRETSPYLLQHRDNPVHWIPWGEEAFARARAENKPILLSVGYAACHWCHVMAHESFENPAIAGLMNDLFISVKVDREERPDVDQIYQHALALLGQSGGWPLTMFLTPAREPFWGGTYFPQSPRYGRPGFGDVLQGVAETFRERPEAVRQNATALGQALAHLAEAHPGDGLSPAILDPAAERFLSAVDRVDGGLGSAPKFPQVPVFTLLWRAWLRTRRTDFRDAVLITLRRMSQGGIYDHLGGGFARYSVDERWLVPHFEKMLYDNAQLIELMTLVWQSLRAPLLEARVRETVGWVLREMIVDGGGFAGSLDADSEGEEGRFYLWTAAEIDTLLGAQSPSFKRAYDVTPAGNFEGAVILNRLDHLELGSAEEEAALAVQRQVLSQARARRAAPARDDKVLADWNGLMIAALAEAGAVFQEPTWIAAAVRAFAFVQSRMIKDGRLAHSWRAERLNPAATLDDHVQMARAALALVEAGAGNRDELIAAAAGWIDHLDHAYLDDKGGGYFFTPVDARDLLVRHKSVHDNAVPSGNATLVAVLIRLFHLTADPSYQARAEAVVKAFAGEVERNLFPLPTLLNAVDLMNNGILVVIVGEPGSSDTLALERVVRERALPNRVLLVVAPGERDRAMVGGRATAYVCQGAACSAPVNDAKELAALLGKEVAPP